MRKENEAMLRLVDIEKRYDAPEGAPDGVVLQNLSLEAKQGESLAVVGPSGSGKSTLLNIIGALDRPTRGTVFLKGQNLTDLDEATLSGIRATQIGFVFQSHHLLPQCSAIENALLPRLALGGETSETEPRLRARRLLEQVGLGERLLHRPGQLSGGERQRVAVVRALVNRPSLVLADEPTGSLDRDNARQLMDLLVELNKNEGVTLIVATHAQDLAGRLDRILALEKGRLVERAHDAS